MSFLVQDGVLRGAGAILDRMSELKSLYNDVIMSAADKENYDKEFRGASGTVIQFKPNQIQRY